MKRRLRKKMNERIEVIGLDHGWSCCKTANDVYVSGVEEMITRPNFYDNVLEINDRYYHIGGKRMEVKNTKVENDNYYLLTLAGIAKELDRRGTKSAEVVLSVGLPLTRYSEEKEDFKNYLMRQSNISFRFEQREYKVHLLKVYVYPQCYAAVVNMIPTFGSQVLAVDVGSWTVDLMPIMNRKPYDSRCNTMNEGIIRCMNEIKKQTIRGKNGRIDEMHIQDYMMTGKTELDEFYEKVMKKEVTDFVKRIFDFIREDGYNLDMIPIVFVGGGASIIQRFGNYEDYKVSFVTDIRANAKGFEMLARIALRKGM